MVNAETDKSTDPKIRASTVKLTLLSSFTDDLQGVRGSECEHQDAVSFLRLLETWCCWHLCDLLPANVTSPDDSKQSVQDLKTMIRHCMTIYIHWPDRISNTELWQNQCCSSEEVEDVTGLDTHWAKVMTTLQSRFWAEHSLTSHQTHYRSYRGQVFAGQMTQPTVSQHWRKTGSKD